MRASAIRGISACLMLCAAVPCLAQGRPNTATMSCKGAAGLVSARGAVVLDTGPTTYDRYVRDEGFCNVPEEVTKPAFVRAADNPQCFIGYYCVDRPIDNR